MREDRISRPEYRGLRIRRSAISIQNVIARMQSAEAAQ